LKIANKLEKFLADELVQTYRYEDCAVVALNDGGVVVGETDSKSTALYFKHAYS